MSIHSDPKKHRLLDLVASSRPAEAVSTYADPGMSRAAISMMLGSGWSPEAALEASAMVRESGSPRMRKTKGRSSYNAFTNTMNVRGGLDDFVDELAHARQVNERGLIPTLSRSLVEMLRYKDDSPGLLGAAIYDLDPRKNRYDTEGTLEHEAHGPIKQALLERLMQAQRTRTSR